MLALAALTALAGCGSDDRPTTFDLARGVVGGVLPGGDDAAQDARAVLTPAMIANSPTSALLAVLVERDVGYTLVPNAVNGETVQWRDISGGGLMQRDGILVGTRGLGWDLFTADVSGLSAALRGGGGRDVLRVNRFIDGTNKVRARQYLCDVVAVGREAIDVYGRIDRTTLFEERCTGEADAFVNRYWLRSDGLIVRSRERVSPQFGDIELTLVAE